MAFDFLIFLILVVRLTLTSSSSSSSSSSTDNDGIIIINRSKQQQSSFPIHATSTAVAAAASAEEKYETVSLYDFILADSSSRNSAAATAVDQNNRISNNNNNNEWWNIGDDFGGIGGGGGVGGNVVGLLNNRATTTTTAECIDIPLNLSLCNGIGYTKMRLPNLLDHDTIYEVSQQAASWIPLLNIKCHPDTRRFLCSVFCPVCLDHKIYPCRSLCENVKIGCETRMKMYGFPWPDMFNCRRFPKDNDMCITSELTANASETDNQCKICEQSSTVENILDSYCQSTVAMRAKLKKISSNYFTFKKMKAFKGSDLITNDVFTIASPEKCCDNMLKPTHAVYFIIGSFEENQLFKPLLIVPWLTKHSKSFKKAVKMLRTLNCSDPDNITHSVIIHSPMMLLYSTVKSTNEKQRRFSNHTTKLSSANGRKKHKRKNSRLSTNKPTAFRSNRNRQ